MNASWGQEAEEEARRYAADLGVPDFVYDPVVVEKGNSTREVSDGLLIVRDRGLILQSKARDPDAETNPQKLKDWATREIQKATKQVRGSRRSIASGGLHLKSRRGHSLTLDSCESWPGVILLRASDWPPDIPAISPDPNTIVMTHRDWFSLLHRIRSSSGVIDYVYRLVAEGTSQLGLGNEVSRYLAFAEADAAWVRTNGGHPTLPLKAVDPDDEVFLAVLDEWIDADIAQAKSEYGAFDPDQIRRAIEAIDAIPVQIRIEFGKAILNRIHQANATGQHRSGALSALPSENRLLFFFDTSRNWEDPTDFEAHVFAYGVVRHEEINRIHGQGFTLLLARLSTASQGVMRTFVSLHGDTAQLEMPSDVRWSILELHGMHTPAGSVPVSKLRRNDPCPCESGKKFKSCHGG